MRTKINKHHKELLNQVENVSSAQPFKTEQGSAYAGHCEKSYPISASQLRKIAKEWAAGNKNIKLQEYINLLNSIYTDSKSSTEKYLGGYLIKYAPKLRRQMKPKLVNLWLENMIGWAQIDSLCQSKFSADDLLDNWEGWKEMIRSLNKSPNVGKRRASLVLLTRPVRESKDGRFANLAVENIETLKKEKDKLITKAVSWLLREMIKLHRPQVEAYLAENKECLPGLAVREAINKLETGRK